MHRISAGFSGLVLIVVTSLVLPLELLANWLDWPLARTLPVWWHGFALARLGVRVHVSGAPGVGRPLLITANHSSWLDISILASRMPLSFVAKSEVGRWPLIGLFARLQRCLFVERERRLKTGAVAGKLAERLAAGDVMVLFPEGTSNDGNGILPFRSALLGAATAALGRGEGAVVWIQPVAIVYRRLQGLPIGRFERPRVAWYGDMDLMPHLLVVFTLRALDVDLIWGDPVPFSAGTDRKLMACELEQRVRAMMTVA